MINRNFGRADSATLALIREGLSEAGVTRDGRTRLPKSYAISWLADEIARAEASGDFVEEGGLRFLTIDVPVSSDPPQYARRHCEVILKRTQADVLMRVLEAIKKQGLRLPVRGEQAASAAPRSIADAVRFLTIQVANSVSSE